MLHKQVFFPEGEASCIGHVSCERTLLLNSCADAVLFNDNNKLVNSVFMFEMILLMINNAKSIDKNSCHVIVRNGGQHRLMCGNCGGMMIMGISHWLTSQIQAGGKVR